MIFFMCPLGAVEEGRRGAVNQVLQAKERCRRYRVFIKGTDKLNIPIVFNV